MNSLLNLRKTLAVMYFILGILFGFGMAKIMEFNSTGTWVSTVTFGFCGFILMLMILGKLRI